MKVALLMCMSLLILGCSSSQDMFKSKDGDVDANAQNDLGIRCEIMSRTGSNKKTKICRTSEQMKKDQEVAQRELDKLQRKTGLTQGN